jgi:hypothetical protein
VIMAAHATGAYGYREIAVHFSDPICYVGHATLRELGNLAMFANRVTSGEFPAYSKTLSTLSGSSSPRAQAA